MTGPVPPREFRFTSEVPIWLDYHGKHVTMDQVVGSEGTVPPRGRVGGRTPLCCLGSGSPWEPYPISCQGTFAGLLIGLAQLNCSELKLKRLCCRHG